MLKYGLLYCSLSEFQLSLTRAISAYSAWAQIWLIGQSAESSCRCQSASLLWQMTQTDSVCLQNTEALLHIPDPWHVEVWSTMHQECMHTACSISTHVIRSMSVLHIEVIHLCHTLIPCSSFFEVHICKLDVLMSHMELSAYKVHEIVLKANIDSRTRTAKVHKTIDFAEKM